MHRQQREHLAPLGHVAEAALHDPRRVLRRDVLAARTSTVPLRGSMMPEMVFRIVDLPAPLAPSTVAISALRDTRRLTPRIARIGP